MGNWSSTEIDKIRREHANQASEVGRYLPYPTIELDESFIRSPRFLSYRLEYVSAIAGLYLFHQLIGSSIIPSPRQAKHKLYLTVSLKKIYELSTWVDENEFYYDRMFPFFATHDEKSIIKTKDVVRLILNVPPDYPVFFLGSRSDVLVWPSRIYFSNESINECSDISVSIVPLSPSTVVFNLLNPFNFAPKQFITQYEIDKEESILVRLINFRHQYLQWLSVYHRDNCRNSIYVNFDGVKYHLFLTGNEIDIVKVAIYPFMHESFELDGTKLSYVNKKRKYSASNLKNIGALSNLYDLNLSVVSIGGNNYELKIDEASNFIIINMKRNSDNFMLPIKNNIISAYGLNPRVFIQTYFN